jgi:hypothetical protein
VLPVTSASVITRVVVVPQPPLLLPELVAGAAGETAALREACLRAVRELAEVAPEWTAAGVTQPGDAAGSWVPHSARGSFLGFGADVPVALAEGPGERGDLPLSALITGWLREKAGAKAARVRLVDAGASPRECRELGQSLAEETAGQETGLLILGDGSNRHGLNAPGGHDDRAAAFDAAVATALGQADAAALLALDPVFAAELGASGRAVWQVLAGFAEGGSWRGELRYSDAPFGVAGHVAVWDRV